MSSNSSARPADHLTEALEQARLENGIAHNVVDDAAELVRAQGVAEDPHVILRFGQFQARLHASDGLLTRAHSKAQSAPDASAWVAAIEARAFASDLVAEVSGQVVAWGGPLRTGRQRRDAGGLLPRAGDQWVNPWSYRYAGNYYLRGIEPPLPGTTSTAQGINK